MHGRYDRCQSASECVPFGHSSSSNTSFPARITLRRRVAVLNIPIPAAFPPVGRRRRQRWGCRAERQVLRRFRARVVFAADNVLHVCLEYRVDSSTPARHLLPDSSRSPTVFSRMPNANREEMLCTISSTAVRLEISDHLSPESGAIDQISPNARYVLL